MQTNESETFSEAWFRTQSNYEVLRIADSLAHMEGVNEVERAKRNMALIRTLTDRLVDMSPDLKKARMAREAD